MVGEQGLQIIARKTLKDFSEAPWYRDCRESLSTWYAIARRAEWSGPFDFKAQFRNASIIGGNRVVFNIAGNKYRLVVKFNYPAQIAYIRFIGTHEQYDWIDVETI